MADHQCSAQYGGHLGQEGVFRGNGDLLLVDVDGLFIGSVGAGKGREIRALLFGDW